jgi:putative DNA primase/helicase
MTPREELAEVLRSVGGRLTGEHPILDGRLHRFPVEGDKRGEQSGAYVGHVDGHPAGYLKNHRTGIEMNWKAKGYVLDAAMKATLEAEAVAKRAARTADEARRQEAAAERVSAQMATLLSLVTPTPYLDAKGIGAHAGVLTDEAGQTTYVLGFDAQEKPWTVQVIAADGTKRFAKGSRKTGCFHPVGGFEALAVAPVLVIAEGYATAATLAEVLGYTTVAAFDAGNLAAVARALHDKYPQKPVLIAGDDDRPLQATQGINPGRVKAKAAAEAVGGRALFPLFAPGEQTADPKAFTDFNDLASKSALGRAGVARQLKAAVKKMLLDQRERPRSKRLDATKRRRPARIG